MELNEKRKKLETCLGEDLTKQYFQILRKAYLFKQPATREEVYREICKLLVTEEQISCGNAFITALLAKETPTKIKSTPQNTTDNGVFESVDYPTYVQASNKMPHSDFTFHSSALELFMPDSSFVSNRIRLTMWKCDMEGADDKVTDLIVYACQVFVKNILTTMISRIKSYKIRDRKFLYGFNSPVPDPFLRNSKNVIDDTQESNVEVSNDDDCFVSRCKPSLERVEQQVAFAYSCSKRRKCENVLTVRLLYDTLKDNPQLLGLHGLQSVSLLKLGLQLGE